MMVFDPTKTRVKSTILHQLTDGNWFVSHADQRLVMSTSFEIIMQMFWNRNQNRARMKWMHEPQQLVRQDHCRDGARFAWNNILNWELSFFSANDDTGVNLLVSLRNLHAVSSSGELYTLSRDMRISSNVIDRPCHSWMRERTGRTTCQIEKRRGLWPIQTDESNMCRYWVFWDDYNVRWRKRGWSGVRQCHKLADARRF